MHFTPVYNLVFLINHMAPANRKKTKNAFSVSRKKKNWNYVADSSNDNCISESKLLES